MYMGYVPGVGGGAMMTSMPLPNGSYMGVQQQQQGMMSTNQGQVMYGVQQQQQQQWSMNQVTHDITTHVQNQFITFTAINLFSSCGFCSTLTSSLGSSFFY